MLALNIMLLLVFVHALTNILRSASDKWRSNMLLWAHYLRSFLIVACYVGNGSIATAGTTGTLQW